MSQATTFLCMSWAKVVLAIKPNIYVKINSLTTALVAAIFAMSLAFLDFGLRIYLHIIHSCQDKITLTLYQLKFKSELCYLQNNNQTLSNFSTDKANFNLSSIAADERCFSYPILRILILATFCFELLKVILGSVRIVKKYQNKHKKIIPNNQSNQTNMTESRRVDISIIDTQEEIADVEHENDLVVEDLTLPSTTFTIHNVATNNLANQSSEQNKETEQEESDDNEQTLTNPQEGFNINLFEDESKAENYEVEHQCEINDLPDSLPHKIEVSTEHWKQIFFKSIKDTFFTLIMKKSTWNLLSYVCSFILFFGSSKDLAEKLYSLFRLEAYIIPVFWTLTDEKVMLFLKTHFKRMFRIYQYS